MTSHTRHPLGVSGNFGTPYGMHRGWGSVRRNRQTRPDWVKIGFGGLGPIRDDSGAQNGKTRLWGARVPTEKGRRISLGFRLDLQNLNGQTENMYIYRRKGKGETKSKSKPRL